MFVTIGGVSELLLLMVVVVVGVVIWRVVKSKSESGNASERSKPDRQTSQPIDPLADWSSSGGDNQFFALKPGDLIKTDTQDFLVRGTITLDDGGTVWWEHLIDDAKGDKRWLSVENEDGVEISLWSRIPLSDIESGSPGDRSIVVRGVAYKLVESGNAGYRAVGTTSTAPSGTLEYIDYEAADGRGLSLERYDAATWEISIGDKVLPSELAVFPSDGSPTGP